MKPHRSVLLIPGLALAFSACAPQKPHGSPDPKVANFKPAESAPKKPVRMNGRGKVSSISLTDFFPLQQSGQVLIYDARPVYYYNLGHIPGAISLTRADCDAQITKREAEIKAALAAKKPIVVYCTNLFCADARTVARHLSGFGYPSSVLTGGWETWKDSGMPTQ